MSYILQNTIDGTWWENYHVAFKEHVMNNYGSGNINYWRDFTSNLPPGAHFQSDLNSIVFKHEEDMINFLLKWS